MTPMREIRLTAVAAVTAVCVTAPLAYAAVTAQWDYNGGTCTITDVSDRDEDIRAELMEDAGDYLASAYPQFNSPTTVKTRTGTTTYSDYRANRPLDEFISIAADNVDGEVTSAERTQLTNAEAALFQAMVSAGFTGQVAQDHIDVLNALNYPIFSTGITDVYGNVTNPDSLGGVTGDYANANINRLTQGFVDTETIITDHFPTDVNHLVAFINSDVAQTTGGKDLIGDFVECISSINAIMPKPSVQPTASVPTQPAAPTTTAAAGKTDSPVAPSTSTPAFVPFTTAPTTAKPTLTAPKPTLAPPTSTSEFVPATHEPQVSGTQVATTTEPSASGTTKQTSTQPSPSTSNGTPSNGEPAADNTAAIVGGVVGGILALAAIIGILFSLGII